MHHLKARIFAVLLILVSIGLICVIGGLFLLIFPSMAGKPTTTREKIIVLLVFVIGMAAGLVNWYLMDPGFFGR